MHDPCSNRLKTQKVKWQIDFPILLTPQALHQKCSIFPFTHANRIMAAAAVQGAICLSLTIHTMIRQHLSTHSGVSPNFFLIPVHVCSQRSAAGAAWHAVTLQQHRWSPTPYSSYTRCTLAVSHFGILFTQQNTPVCIWNFPCLNLTDEYVICVIYLVSTSGGVLVIIVEIVTSVPGKRNKIQRRA